MFQFSKNWTNYNTKRNIRKHKILTKKTFYKIFLPTLNDNFINLSNVQVTEFEKTFLISDLIQTGILTLNKKKKKKDGNWNTKESINCKLKIT